MGKKIFVIAPNFYGIDTSICRAFESLGFTVVLKNTRRAHPVESVSIRIMKRLPSAKHFLNSTLKLFLEKDNAEYIACIEKIKPDMLFVIKGETIFPDTLKRIKERLNIPCVAYIWDCPFYSFAGHGVDACRKNNFSDGMMFYDHIFVYDPYYVEQIAKRGVSHVSYLPLATDPDVYRRMDTATDAADRFEFDVAFVGAPLPNRIKVLDGLNGFNLGVFGDGWEKRFSFSGLPQYYKGKAAGEKVLKIYSSSKIVLNIHDPEATYGVNTRTFDIPACGAFELVDFKPEIRKLFRLGEEMVCYRNTDDLQKLVRFYLDNPAQRKAIADRGKAKVLGEHTWLHRVKEVAHVLCKKGILT